MELAGVLIRLKAGYDAGFPDLRLFENQCSRITYPFYYYILETIHWSVTLRSRTFLLPDTVHIKQSSSTPLVVYDACNFHLFSIIRLLIV